MANIIRKSNNLKPQDNVVKDIVNIIEVTANYAALNLNLLLIKRNWLIGKRIYEEVLTNRSNDYGKQLIKNLSKELSKYGTGFKQRNIYNMLNFYKCYQNIFQSMIGKSLENENILQTFAKSSIQDINHFLNLKTSRAYLPWSFYLLLIKIEDEKIRDWYEQEVLSNTWSIRQLERNIKTDYYHRVLSHQIKHKTNQIASINPMDYLKSPFIFEFLGFKPNYKYKESELEQALIDNLKDFLIELGKGYTYAGRQVHLRNNNQDYYVDLVFYNSILKCYVLIDLKIDKIQNKDLGQMLIYLDLYDKQYKHNDDNPSIGIILSSDNNEVIVEYLINNPNNHIVPSKYLTYLPTKEELTKEIKDIKKINRS